MRYDLNMKTHESFERAFVLMAVRLSEKLGYSHSELGRAVFGAESGVRIWAEVRTKARQPRKLSLSESHKIATFLGKGYPEFVWAVQQELEKTEEHKL